jgi:hypothetical protein
LILTFAKLSHWDANVGIGPLDTAGGSRDRPDRGSKERNREIAANESTRQTVSSIRVSVWAIAVAVVIGLAAFGWVLLNNK